MLVRPERLSDIVAVRALNEAAFGTNAEANLVDALREQAAPTISLVADRGGSIVGHIFFSQVALIPHTGLRVMGLAPMAVSPEAQRSGIGSALVRAGLGSCRQLACDAVVVVGHAEYYPRFGFVSASRFGLRCEYEVPEDVFMALELEPGILSGKTGLIRYHPLFATV